MIPLAEPTLTGKEREYIRDVISSGWVSGGGPFVDKFEEEIANATGREWAIATSSGTEAIRLAYLTAGIPIGSTIKMPSFAYFAASSVALQMGYQVRFTDIQESWTYEATILSPDHGLGICDAAPALGAKQACSLGWMACLSFNGNKIITTGQGGAVVGDDLVLERRARHIAVMSKVGRYEQDAVGLNCRMANINAAIGCAQIERLGEFVNRKREIAKRYCDALGEGFPMWPDSVCWMSGVKSTKPGLTEYLNNKGIDARPFWKPLHLQEPYQNCKKSKLDRTEALWQQFVCLPCSVNLSEADQDKVIRTCREFLR